MHLFDMGCKCKNLKHVTGFPAGPVVKHPPCSVGDEGSIPDWETNIPYATEKLNLHSCKYGGSHTPETACHG